MATRTPAVVDAVEDLLTARPGLAIGERPLVDAEIASSAGAQRAALFARNGLPVVFPTLEDFVERSSALIGSLQQVTDKVLRYHQGRGHELMHLHADVTG